MCKKEKKKKNEIEKRKKKEALGTERENKHTEKA